MFAVIIRFLIKITFSFSRVEGVSSNSHFEKPTRAEFQVKMREALRIAKERLRQRTRGPRIQGGNGRNRRDFWNDGQPEEPPRDITEPAADN